MSLVSLFARLNPFIAIVHKDKNHRGECEYAAKIFEYMQLDPNVKQLLYRLKNLNYLCLKTPTPFAVLLRYTESSTTAFPS